jgi:hypothetical protein
MCSSENQGYIMPKKAMKEENDPERKTSNSLSETTSIKSFRYSTDDD